MPSLARRYPHCLWQVYVSKRPDMAPGSWTDPQHDFDAAVDAYDEACRDGWQAWVLGLDLPTGSAMDHTAEAHAHLRARLEGRGQELPAWMEDAA